MGERQGRKNYLKWAGSLIGKDVGLSRFVGETRSCWFDSNSARMSVGTGLRFDGYPTDVEKFSWILMRESCHPKAVLRILERIKQNGYDLLTVSSTLPFDKIKESLKEVGVIMTFIPPLEDWYLKYDDGKWDETILAKILANR